MPAIAEIELIQLFKSNIFLLFFPELPPKPCRPNIIADHPFQSSMAASSPLRQTAVLITRQKNVFLLTVAQPKAEFSHKSGNFLPNFKTASKTYVHASKRLHNSPIVRLTGKEISSNDKPDQGSNNAPLSGQPVKVYSLKVIFPRLMVI